jgi:predicted RNA binding protein YcfA (HicA-like mRNA interferase family)
MPTAREVVRFLKLKGFQEKRQSGSHLVLQHPSSKIRLVVPMHSGDIPKGLLRRIVKDSGYSMEEFETS